MNQPKLNAEILVAALEGLEAQKLRIESSIAEVKQLLSARDKPQAAAAEVRKPRRRLSAAARKRIATAQRKRWAAHRKKTEEAEKTAAPAAAKKAGAKRATGKAAGRRGKKTRKAPKAPASAEPAAV